MSRRSSGATSLASTANTPVMTVYGRHGKLKVKAVTRRSLLWQFYGNLVGVMFMVLSIFLRRLATAPYNGFTLRDIPIFRLLLALTLLIGQRFLAVVLWNVLKARRTDEPVWAVLDPVVMEVLTGLVAIFILVWTGEESSRYESVTLLTRILECVGGFATAYLRLAFRSVTKADLRRNYRRVRALCALMFWGSVSWYILVFADEVSHVANEQEEGGSVNVYTLRPLILLFNFNTAIDFLVLTWGYDLEREGPKIQLADSKLFPERVRRCCSRVVCLKNIKIYNGARESLFGGIIGALAYGVPKFWFIFQFRDALQSQSKTASGHEHGYIGAIIEFGYLAVLVVGSVALWVSSYQKVSDYVALKDAVARTPRLDVAKVGFMSICSVIWNIFLGFSFSVRDLNFWQYMGGGVGHLLLGTVAVWMLATRNRHGKAPFCKWERYALGVLAGVELAAVISTMISLSIVNTWGNAFKEYFPLFLTFLLPFTLDYHFVLTEVLTGLSVQHKIGESEDEHARWASCGAVHGDGSACRCLLTQEQCVLLDTDPCRACRHPVSRHPQTARSTGKVTMRRAQSLQPPQTNRTASKNAKASPPLYARHPVVSKSRASADPTSAATQERLLVSPPSRKSKAMLLQ